ncbi:hypothetical protein EMCRGX_G003935 [Ephydatia muelleri]
METEEYNDIVRFLESKSDKQRSWPRGVEESKDKEAKRAYRQKCESFATYDGLLFKLKRRKKPETGALASTRATDARLRDEPQDERYRVVKIDEKMRVLESVHKDPAGGHFGIHKTQEKIAERYYWKGMTKDVAEYCGTCLVCQRRNKMPKKTASLHPVGVPNRAFAQWARLPIELDLPPHKFQADKDDNPMEKLMVSSKLIGEKRSDACEKIHIAQATQKRQYDRKHCRQEEFVVGDEVWYANSRQDTKKGDKLSTKRLGPVFVAKACGKNTYKLIGLKRKFHSDQLVKVKRAIAGDIVLSAKTEVGMCDGAQHSDEKGSMQKEKRTRNTDVTPDWKRTKASDVTLLTKPVSECDGVLQPVIEEVAATIEGSDKGENCSGRAKTSDVAPTTKLEGSMSNCTQQSADGEVVVVRGQSIHERTETNAKGQIASHKHGEHLRSICRRSIDSIFYNVYIDGRHDGVFEKLNPKELKCFFRKWPIINCDVVVHITIIASLVHITLISSPVHITLISSPVNNTTSI